MPEVFKFTLVTGSPGKAENYGRFLSRPFNHKKLDLVEVQSPDIAVVLEHKAREAYTKVGNPVLVDDAALEIKEWGGLPGAFIKWNLNIEDGTMKLCRMLNDFPDRSAVSRIGLGLFDGKTFRLFEGRVPGVIAPEPRGTRSFGFDSIFIPGGYTQTRAEMDQKDEEVTNARFIALRKLEEFLESNPDI